MLDREALLVRVTTSPLATWFVRHVASRVEVQLRGERFAARAAFLDAAEQARVWPAVQRAIPQLKVYEARTKRSIRVVRLTRVEREVG